MLYVSVWVWGHTARVVFVCTAIVLDRCKVAVELKSFAKVMCCYISQKTSLTAETIRPNGVAHIRCPGKPLNHFFSALSVQDAPRSASHYKHTHTQTQTHTHTLTWRESIPTGRVVHVCVCADVACNLSQMPTPFVGSYSGSWPHSPTK